MKVLIVNRHIQDTVGGSEIQCDIIAKYLKRFGHRVIYGAVDSQRDSYSTPYEVYPARRLNPISLRRMIVQLDPDLVFWRYNKNSLLVAAITCRLYHNKLVFSISHVNDVKKWAYKPPNMSTDTILSQLLYAIHVFKRLLSSRINYIGYRFIDGLVSQRQDLLKCMPSHARLAKIWINNSMESTSSLPFVWKRPYIVWVANIKKVKNPTLYIKAAKELRDEPVDFLMIGKIQDPSYHYMEEHDQLPQNLYYLGIRDLNEINSILRNSLFLVHTCDPEGFSNNLIQAWLQEKPTISLFFDPDGFIERNGVGCFSKSFDMMCKHIQLLIENPGLRNEMGRRAGRLARALFSPEKNTRKQEAFLKEVLNGR